MNVLHSTPLSFVKLIHNIASAYNLDLKASRLFLRLVKDNGDNLVIEKFDKNIIKVAQYKQLGTENIPFPEVEFLIDFFPDDDSFLRESWIPLRKIQGFDYQQVACTNFDGDLVEYDSQATKELASLCLDWQYILMEGQWHIHGKPSPGVTATIRYVDPTSSVRQQNYLSDDLPQLDLEEDFFIRGNQMGLLILLRAIANSLAREEHSQTEVFNSTGEKLQLKVSVNHSKSEQNGAYSY